MSVLSYALLSLSAITSDTSRRLLFFSLKKACLGLYNKTLNKKKEPSKNRGLFCSNATQKRERERKNTRADRARDDTSKHYGFIVR
jgi:hypothetical protein